MNKKLLYALWAGLFILCAGLGFIPEPEGSLQMLLTVVSLAFFLPPAWLLYRGDVSDAKLIFSFSALSLGLTLALLVLNFLTALQSEFLGLVLHYTLVIVSCPMICSGHWAMSLFLWACLLIASRKQKKQENS